MPTSPNLDTASRSSTTRSTAMRARGARSACRFCAPRLSRTTSRTRARTSSRSRVCPLLFFSLERRRLTAFPQSSLIAAPSPSRTSRPSRASSITLFTCAASLPPPSARRLPRSLPARRAAAPSPFRARATSCSTRSSAAKTTTSRRAARATGPRRSCSGSTRRTAAVRVASRSRLGCRRERGS